MQKVYFLNVQSAPSTTRPKSDGFTHATCFVTSVIVKNVISSRVTVTGSRESPFQCCQTRVSARATLLAC